MTMLSKLNLGVEDSKEMDEERMDNFQSSFARALAQASLRREKIKSETINTDNNILVPVTKTITILPQEKNEIDHQESTTWHLQEEFQRLLEENRRLKASLNISPMQNNKHEQRAEIALLQSRVNTLSWQLSQSEANRRVLRTVSEQVVNFLDRVNNAMSTLEKQRSPPKSGGRVPRSRSTHESRRQSIDGSRKQFTDDISLIRSESDALSPESWKRSRVSMLEEESANPGRLGQQARRLARTVRSLLNTQDQEIKAVPSIRRRLSFDNGPLDNIICTSSDSDHSPSRKQETDESGFSSLGSFQEIGLPTYPSNGLPINHSRCRSTPAGASVTATKHSYFRRNSDNSAEITTTEKLKVLWV